MSRRGLFRVSLPLMSRLTDTIKQNIPQWQFLRRGIDLRPIWHQFGLLPIVALTALLAPFVPSPPGSVQRHGAQTVCVEAGAALLLAALLCRPWPLSSPRLSSLSLSSLRSSFQAAPLARLTFLFLALLLLWGLISCVSAPTAFAVQGLLLLGVGVLVASVTAAQASSTRRALLAVASVVLPALLVAFSGLIQMGSGSNPLAVGVLKDHQLFGAFLLLPIPLCLALSLAPGPLTQRLTGQTALLICAAGLRESQNRSAWLGTAVSLVVFAGLLCYLYAADYRDAGSRSRERRRRERRRRNRKSYDRKSYDRRSRASAPELPEMRLSRGNAIVPALLGLVALIGFVLISPSLDARFARMRPAAPVMHGSDESLRWRKIVWLGTRRMIAEKPLAGWGVGSFPARHEPFTRTGYPADRVSVRGPSIEDEAHDSYLQVWAELGIVGLLLWLGAFFSLIGSGVQSLRHLRRGSVKQWILIGGVSALVGQMTDALANPAWQFGSVLLPLWIVFGLTAALSAPRREAQPPPARPLLWRIAQYILAAGLGLWLLSLIWRTAFALPAPHL